MRNLKAKGFTLVELIVVIAIIGVLAAVLVPAMLGYMRDSKISQANQNAHAVYTAAQAAVTKYATANGTSKTQNATFTGSDAADKATGDKGADLESFKDYLGDQFKGNYKFVVSKSGDTINWAAWSLDGAPATIPGDEETQIKMYKGDITGGLVGIHPQYPSGDGITTQGSGS